MNTLHRTTYGAYHIGARKPLDPNQTEHLVTLFKAPTTPTLSVLGGRTSIVTDVIEGLGPVVIKHYRRGGLISRFIKKTYLGLGKPRCQSEFEMLSHVRSIGVSAPQPVAFGHRGGLFYQCWLATLEIRSHQTLAQLSRVDLERSLEMIDSVAEHIERLIQAGIRHVDLHPGNVLVDPDDHIFLIDFDRAGPSRLDQRSLRSRYLERWKRAVTKHRLEPALWQNLEAALGKSRRSQSA